MSRAETRTKLPLATWARIMGVHPLHFEGVTIETDPNALCDQVYFQHEWQDVDRVGREAIARAIAAAEEDLERYLGYRLAPSWEVDEWRPTVRPYRPELVNTNAKDTRGYFQPVKANWSHFISGGVETKALVDDAVAITYSDADADNYDETATVTVTVASGQDPCEIGVFYPGKGGDDLWEIRPVSVSVSGVTATITFRRELAVLETLLEAFSPGPVDGLVDASFLTTVDVYRRYNDPQTQATLMWEPTGTCGCGTTSCPNCTYSMQTGCLFVRGDPKLSMVAYQPATWDADNEQFNGASLAVARQPDVVRLYYYAGLRDKRLACPMRDMASEWERIVAYYAASMLDRPPCDCGTVKEQIERWTMDMAYIEGAEQLSKFQLSTRDLESPFGTRAGALYAWKRVQRHGEAAGRVVLA